jgi:murein L,D-transpeptidase YcbB/YkuD
MAELRKVLMSRITLVLLVFVFAGLFVFLCYLVARDAEVTVLSKEGLIKIVPEGKERLGELEERVGQLEERLGNSVSKEAYTQLVERYNKARKEYEAVSSELGKVEKIVSGVKSDKPGVVSKVALLHARAGDFESDAQYSLAVLRAAIERGGSINTTNAADDEARKALYRHVQKCLSAVGAYAGACDGGQVETYNAVMKFQEQSGLTVDGIIGRQTLASLEAKFGEG